MVSFKQVEKMVTEQLTYVSYASYIRDFPIELVNVETIKEHMNFEQNYLLIDKTKRTGSFEPYYNRMIADAVAKYDWTPRKELSNPCAEILLGTPQFTVIDGYHRLRALQTISQMGRGGMPLPFILNNIQNRQIARELWKICYPVHRDTPIALMLGNRELNKKKFQQLLRFTSSNIMAQLIYGFYNQNRMIQWWYWIRQLNNQIRTEEGKQRFKEIVLSLIWDAVGTDKPLEKQYQTSTVIALLKDMRVKDNYENMPVLADALQDVGFDNEQLLTHYRTNKYFSAGSWIFRKVGLT